MTRLMAAALLAVTVGYGAYAQDNGLVAPELDKPAPGHLLDQDYLAPTGATVPRPGVPQGSGPTALDRKIQEQDNRLDNSICKGC
ncbi:MAG TPA: hypothetical protein VLI91_13405 [Roseiarcus sp.]|nr:hypothetical protein [Roseiarcus sp.]